MRAMQVTNNIQIALEFECKSYHAKINWHFALYTSIAKYQRNRGVFMTTSVT